MYTRKEETEVLPPGTTVESPLYYPKGGMGHILSMSHWEEYQNTQRGSYWYTVEFADGTRKTLDTTRFNVRR